MNDQPGEREDNADRTHNDDGGRERSGASTEEEPRAEPTVETENGRAAASEASGDSGHPQREPAGGADPRERDDEEERRKSGEEFAREHDPAKHDIAAGEESRQKGDWTADEAGGPQVGDADRNLVEGATPGEPGGSHERSDHDNGDAPADRRRTSALEEVRDGGYGVGSAAIIEDGALPLGHPVKAWEDTNTFATPDHPSYENADPHLWFTDADAAQKAGFRQID